MAGKNFSRNQKESLRNKNDLYQTPHCLTKTFIEAEFDLSKENLFCDFCCGKKALGYVLRQHNQKVIELDIDIGKNFFDITEQQKGIGLMNPPFKLFNDWVAHCFEIFENKFCLLAPTTYLQGISRFNKEETGIFQNKEFPLTKLYTYNRYPMLSLNLRPDGKITTGMQTLSWFVFEKNGPQETVHRWLDIQEYVAKKGEL